jgi:hypothetical protein
VTLRDFMVEATPSEAQLALSYLVWPARHLIRVWSMSGCDVTPPLPRLARILGITGVCTRRASAASLTHLTRVTMRFPRSGAESNGP